MMRSRFLKVSLFATLLLSGVLMLTVVGCSGTEAQLGSGENALSSVSTADNEAKNDSDLNSKETGDLITTTSLPPQATTTSIKTTLTTTKNTQPNEVTKQFAHIVTNKGKIVLELYPQKAPETVKSFVKLAKSGFFNSIKWHRVEPGFVVQTGDPNTKDNNPDNDGKGGPGYTINAEFNDMKHLTGTVAMARSGNDINSAGSQFYICLAPAPFLDGKYTVFGQVVEGMDVVNKIQVGDVMQKVTIANKK